MTKAPGPYDKRPARELDPADRRAWYGRPEDDQPNPWVEGNLGTNITAYLLAGPLTFGGLGWFASHFWLQTRWPIAVGVLLGMALSLYVIWLRYGRR